MIADAPGYSYHFDQEAGHLTISHNFGDGLNATVFDGRYGKDGVFRDDQGMQSGASLATALPSMPMPYAATKRGARMREFGPVQLPKAPRPHEVSRKHAPSLVRTRVDSSRLAPLPTKCSSVRS